MSFITTIQSEVNSLGAGTTSYRRCGMGARLDGSVTEANRQTVIRTAGTFNKLYATILTNDRGASTFRFRNNGINGNQLISIPAATTGEFEDTTNTDSVVAGDLAVTQFVIGAGGTTFTFNVTRMLFKSNTSTTTVFSGDPTNITTGTEFNSIGGSSTTPATEAFHQTKMQTAGTLRNLAVFVSANTRDADVTYLLRKNGVNGNQTITIPTLAIGWFEDLVNTDVVAVGDLVGFSSVGAGTAGTVTAQTSTVSFDTTNSSFMFQGSDTNPTAAATTVYYALAGSAIAAGAEADFAADSGLKFRASKLGLYVSANTVTAASTFRLRVNAANVSQVVSITASTTGHFEDSVNTDAIVATDSLTIQLITGATGTSLTTRSHEMLGVAGGAIKDIMKAGGIVPRVR